MFAVENYAKNGLTERKLDAGSNRFKQFTTIHFWEFQSLFFLSRYVFFVVVSLSLLLVDSSFWRRRSYVRRSVKISVEEDRIYAVYRYAET